MPTETPPGTFGLGGILLAAGGSSRLGQPKQLLEIDGEPLVVRQAKLLLEQSLETVVVVTGAERERVESLLDPLPVKCVFNAGWAQGMGHSLASGISAMPERIRAVMVLLCDQWQLGAGDLAELSSAWSGDPQSAVVSAFDRVTGPPAVLPRSMFEKLSRLKGDQGASKVIRKWKGKVVEIAIPGAGSDIDFIEDIPA